MPVGGTFRAAGCLRGPTEQGFPPLVFAAISTRQPILPHGANCRLPSIPLAMRHPVPHHPSTIPMGSHPPATSPSPIPQLLPSWLTPANSFMSFPATPSLCTHIHASSRPQPLSAPRLPTRIHLPPRPLPGPPSTCAPCTDPRPRIHPPPTTIHGFTAPSTCPLPHTTPLHPLPVHSPLTHTTTRASTLAPDSPSKPSSIPSPL